MNEIVNSVTGELTRPDDVESRIYRAMIVSVAIAVIVSAIVAPWRVTSGLLLGGVLSLLNHRWLSGSVAALLDMQKPGVKPRLKLWKHGLRYLVIAVAVFAGYQLNLISLAATIAGLCAFVPALFAEAGRQFYFAIIRREESF
ncbi:MAG TPA: ATP synthase subunit I [Pyrinomonadaceae bacterium]|nr:ATP synthase subunit I [Pyrinomonadaceae bacterium]